MSEAKYGVLLVTGGHTHQEMYGPAFAADKRCRLIALTDEADVSARTLRLNEALARKLGIPYVADLDEALRYKSVNVVSVCAPPERRGRIALRCVAQAKHLYMDKSLTPRLQEADALVAAVKKHGVRSQMFSFVSTPWAAQAKRLLEDKVIGDLLAIHADAFFAKGRNGTAELGKPRKEEYPPGRQQQIESKREWDNVGVYPITLIHYLTGRKFRTVYGATANYFFREHQKDNVEDFGLLCGTLEGGLPVTISAGRFGWTTHPAAGANRMLLVGSERTVVVDANRPRLEVYTDETPWTPPRVNPEDPMGFWSSTVEEVGLKPKPNWTPALAAAGSDAGFFLDCLDAGRESPMSVVEAAHATEVLLATYLSATKGTVVTLPLPR
jgi:myo-inositol 2-dehydrogenase / D-chiro-inositol 1-dehydrogenase